VTLAKRRWLEKGDLARTACLSVGRYQSLYFVNIDSTGMMPVRFVQIASAPLVRTVHAVSGRRLTLRFNLLGKNDTDAGADLARNTLSHLSVVNHMPRYHGRRLELVWLSHLQSLCLRFFASKWK